MGGQENSVSVIIVRSKPQQQPKHRRSRCVRHAPCQPSVFQAPEIVHPVAAELERASAWLDQQPELLDMIGTCVPGSTCCGRPGLTRDHSALCGAHASDGLQLSGVGVRAARFRLRAALRTGRSVPCAEEVGATEPCSARSTPTRSKRSTACYCRSQAAGDRIGYAGAYRQHRDRDGYPGTVRQPPVVRRRAGADAAAAGGARAAAAGVGARPLPCRQAARAGDPLGARRAAAGGHLPAAAEPGGAHDRLRGGGTGRSVLRN